jgi:hypothetical protein
MSRTEVRSAARFGASIAVATLLVVAGCGDSDGQPAGEATEETATEAESVTAEPPDGVTSEDAGELSGEEKEVANTLEEAWVAIEDGEFARACELSTQQAVQLAEKAFGSCEKSLEQIEPLLDIGGEKDFTKLEVVSVEIDGETATADWELEGDSFTDTLTFEDGVWKLESQQSAG